MHDDFYPSPIQNPEKHQLRDNANYIGLMMLVMEGSFFLLGNVLNLLASVVTLDLTIYLFVYSAAYSIAMALSAILVSVLSGRRHFPLSPSRSVRPADAFFGILAAIGICMAANIAVNFILLFFESFGVPEPEMPDYLQPTVQSLLLNLFVFAVLPALLEELVFRGYVLRALRPHGDWFAVIVSSVMFGLMHGNIAQIPFALIVGVALGWLYIMTDNIWVPVAVHFANNTFSFLLQYCTLGMDEAKLEMVNAFAIFSLIAIGALSLAVLIARRSALFRRLSCRSSLMTGDRLKTLLGAPLFLISVLVFILLTIVDVVGSIK